MSENAPVDNSEKVLQKSPQEKAAQIKRIAKKLTERAAKLEREEYDHPISEGYILRSGGQEGGTHLSYNHYRPGGLVAGEVSVLDDSTVRLTRSINEPENSKLEVKVKVDGSGTEAIIKDMKPDKHDPERMVSHTSIYAEDSIHEDNSQALRGKGTTKKFLDAKRYARASASRILADARAQLALREKHHAKKKADKEDLALRALR